MKTLDRNPTRALPLARICNPSPIHLNGTPLVVKVAHPNVAVPPHAHQHAWKREAVIPAKEGGACTASTKPLEYAAGHNAKGKFVYNEWQL